MASTLPEPQNSSDVNQGMYRRIVATSADSIPTNSTWAEPNVQFEVRLPPVPINTISMNIHDIQESIMRRKIKGLFSNI